MQLAAQAECKPAEEQLSVIPMTPEAGTKVPHLAWQAAGDRILDAAVRCMSRSGLKVSMQLIAREAGTSRGAVYRHFAGRAALVDAVLERTILEELATVAQLVDQQNRLAAQVAEAISAMPGSPPEPLATALRDDPHRRSAWQAEHWRAFWLPRLATARERGEVRYDLDLDDVADWITRLQLSFVGPDADDGSSRANLECYVDEHLMLGLRPR